MAIGFEPGMAELVDQNLKGNAVLEGQRDRRAEAIHQATDGATFFGHGDEDFTGSTIWIQADVDVTFVASDAELVGDGVAGIWQSLATCLVDDLLDNLGRFCFFGLLRFRLGRQRLALLGSIAVDRDGFETQLPSPIVSIGDVFDGGVRRHIDGLADRTGQERLSGGHHFDVRLPTDASGSIGWRECTVEDRQMLVLDVRCAFDRVLFVDVLLDVLDLLRGVTQIEQSEWNRAIDDLEHTAASELLVLHKRDIWFDTGGIAVHHKADRSGRCQHGRLGISESILAASFEDYVPQFAGSIFEISWPSIRNLLDCIAMHLHDSHHRLCVLGVLGKWADYTCHLGAGQVCRTMEKRGDRTAHAMGHRRIIACPVGHDQRTEVRVTKTQRTEQVTVVSNSIRRISCMVDQDFLGDKEQSASSHEALMIKRSVVATELHQVDRGQVARCVVEEHVLRARIAGVDPTTVRASMPLVDRRVVLNSRVSTVPSALGHAIEHLACSILRWLILALL